MANAAPVANAAQVIARGLFNAGCRHAFGMPGGEVLSVMDALVEAGIAFHLVRHENAGGLMAEGSYHMTGAPGILLATLGPGMANAVNAIANAEHNDGADIDELKVTSIYVEQGATLKRFSARAKGRGNRISKPTCHIFVAVGN